MAKCTTCGAETGNEYATCGPCIRALVESALEDEPDQTKDLDPHEVALEAAADAIKQHLGGVSDLPPAVQNTVANLSYVFYALLSDMKGSGGSRILEPFPPVAAEPAEVFSALVELRADATAAFQHLPGLINSMRGVRKQDPAMHRYLVEHFLDSWKYRVRNSEAKPPLLRMAERLEENVREIPDLYKDMADQGLV